MFVDFHCHSSASDGTDTPKKLAENGIEKNFVAMAITDHDNCDGVDEFLEASKNSTLFAIAGTELSIEPGKTFDKFHLLALNVNKDDASLKTLLKKILDGRNKRNERIIENFRHLGFEMGEKDTRGRSVYDYAHGEVLARPHFAQWLIDRGHSTSIKDAFNRYLLPDSPKETRCYEERWHPPQEETFNIIHSAGGLCVMAHPKYWRREWKYSSPDYDDAERELMRLKEIGLDGIESIYQANSGGENVGFSKIAKKLNLLQTAGSDYHGSNKPNISLGMSISDEVILPFLERIGASKL